MIKNTKGFTMVELLAAIVILGILSIIALTSITKILDKTKEEYYKTTEKDLIIAAQSYVQDHRNHLPKKIGNKNKITLRTLKDNKYLTEVKDYNKKPCNLDESYVQIFQYSKNSYSYLSYLKCPNYESTKKVNTIKPEITIDFHKNSSKDDSALKLAEATITITGSGATSSEKNIKLLGYNYSVYKDGKEIINSGSKDANYQEKIIKKIKLEKYTPGKITIKVTATNTYGLTASKTKSTTYKDVEAPICGTITGASTTWTNQNRKITVQCSDGNGSGCTRKEFTKTFKSNIKVGTITIEDEAGNKNNCEVNAYVDKTKPTCSFTGENSSWRNNTVTIKANCADNLSGCSSASKEKVWEFITGTHKTETLSYLIKDEAGNETSCSKDANIYLDTEPPSSPSAGDIGPVSGSNPSGSIKTPATGSIDAGIGIKEYLYLIKNDSTVPANTDPSFKTGQTFTRGCGKSYYAFAIAIDKLGYRSTVKYLGTTSDGANSYTNWSACSASCGGGTQTRKNTCALITTGLKQSCNQQPCGPPPHQHAIAYTGTSLHNTSYCSVQDSHGCHKQARFGYCGICWNYGVIHRCYKGGDCDPGNWNYNCPISPLYPSVVPD